MVLVGERAKLLLEEVERRRRGVEQRLERQELATLAIAHLVDGAHAPVAEALQDLVALGPTPIESGREPAARQVARRDGHTRMLREAGAAKTRPPRFAPRLLADLTGSAYIRLRRGPERRGQGLSRHLARAPNPVAVGAASKRHFVDEADV